MAITILAFVCLGFLIGNLVGMTSESTITVLIPLLFTFAGGSAVAFLPKLEESTRKLAAGAVIALSLSCLIGIYWGVFVSERQLLSPPSVIQAKLPNHTSRDVFKYLKANDISEINSIDQQFRNHELTAEQAYQQLYAFVTSGRRQ